MGDGVSSAYDNIKLDAIYGSHFSRHALTILIYICVVMCWYINTIYQQGSFITPLYNMRCG